jgi:sec-independent protein translocase protein TatA
MGFGGMSLVQLGILLAIVILLFGSRKLRTFGYDLGSAIKGFKSSISDGDAENNYDSSDGQKLTSKEEDENEHRV